MCSRYHVDGKTYEEATSLVQKTDDRLKRKRWDMDIRPMDMAPVIVGVGSPSQGRLMLTEQRFGIPARAGHGIVFNARAESVFERKLFWDGIRFHRAVIPAGWFYEWNAEKEKNVFSRKSGEALFFAGFFDYAEDGEHFIIITTQANHSMRKVHDRMPLVLEKDQIKSWIFLGTEAENLLKQESVELRRECSYEQLSLF